MTVTDAAPAVAETAPPRSSATFTIGKRALLLGIGFAWLTVLLATMRSALTNSHGSDSALIFAAQNLFGPVTAALALGCSAGLFVVTQWRSRLSSTGALAVARRVVLGGLGGLLAGVAGGALTFALIGDQRVSTVYAVCLAAATTLGGLSAALPIQRVLAAGLAGTYATFLVKVILTPFSGNLAPLFGAEKTLDGANAVGNRMFLAFSLVSGLVAGVLVYRGLRRVFEPTPSWPTYMAAGAFPGVLALLAEAFTRLSAEKLMSPLTETAIVERAIIALNSNARINAGMAMLFVGGLTATIILGRSLKR